MLIHHHTREVEWGDCDPAGIVFHPRYLAYFDHCTNLLFTQAGFEPATLQARFGVIGYPVVGLRTRFHAPCCYGDKVCIETRILEFRNSSFEVQHVLKRGDTLAVEAEVTRVWAGRHAEEPRRMQGRTIPEEVKVAMG
ncbi:acyl-CoA thioesterase [Halomonas alkalicola]|uniref:acyl-CoA thioesterase n=1 Tax=Halomonas alkalicola TaxID=1930622 RepID=UPI00265DBE6B|nr:thioesterase family protein [Halomonas alkalicola]